MNKNGLHFSTHRLLFIALIILSGGIGLFTNTALPNLAIPVYASNPVADETDAVIYVASDDESIANAEIYGFELSGGIQQEPAGDTCIPLIFSHNPDNVSIHDMRLTGSSYGTVINSHAFDNRIGYSGHEGICFVAVTDFDAYNNDIFSTRTNCGVRAKDADHFSIHDNTISKAGPTAATLELYGNFHTMGVTVSFLAADDPDNDATATLEYRSSGAGAYQVGFPLTRVDATHFVGSIFWLASGAGYDVRVTFSDPDGDPLDGVVVLGSGSTRAEIVIPAAHNSLVTSSTGSGGACTEAAPCSLTEAINQAQAGDEILLRGGVYYEGEINLPRSGSAGAPIVIKSYPGENAILDGADPDAAFTWTSQGGGVYRTTVHVADPHLVTADGDRLYPYQTLSDLQNLVWGTPGFYADGTTLSVRLAGDADPNGAEMRVSRFNYGFYVEQDFIYFSDLTFRHYGQGNWAKAIYFNNGNDNLVQNSTFAINDLGIGLKRDSNRNLIQNNEFYDTDFMWPWDAVKDGSQLETGGVNFYSPTTGRGNVIRSNVFHDYFDGVTTCPEDNGSETNETDFYENLIYNTGDDGVSADGACNNVRIWGNRIHDVLVGISLAPIYEGPLYAMNNLIYRIGVSNSSFRGMPFKFNSGYDQSGRMYLFHNTADAALPDNDAFELRSPGSWQMIYARNNIWSGTRYAFDNANTSQPLDFDYDNLYTTLPGEFAWWNGLPDTHLNTLAEFQSATGQELHGFDLAPVFADASADDYTLPDGSNMIDKGVPIPGINDGYLGTAPDLGAFEHDAQTYLPIITITATGGSNARLSWERSVWHNMYKIWRSNTPCFSPAGAPYGEVDAAPWQFDDPTALGDPAANHFYVVTGELLGGGATTSNRVGEFDFALTPGE